MNPYVALTHEFNEGGLRAIVSSGQAVVLHRLSVTSKDGDWIARETSDALAHIREVLARHGARYRFGAPLDVRWMRGGWSSHFEFQASGIRVRTDFVTRPPRLEIADVGALFDEQRSADVPVVDPRRLVALKQTGRDRDYAVIGELTRLLVDPRERLLLGRSAADLIELASARPELGRELTPSRPLLVHAIAGDVAALEQALDAERRELMRRDVRRLERYSSAASRWAANWPPLDRELAGLPVGQAHDRIVERALGVLPFTIDGA